MKLPAFYLVITLIAFSGLASADQPDLRAQIWLWIISYSLHLMPETSKQPR